MAVNETQRLLVVKAALMQTTHTPGWKFIRDIANNVVKAAIQASMDEEDSDKGEAKRLKAKALQKGLNDLFNAIEVAQQVGTDEEPEWYSQLAFAEQEPISEIEQ